MRTIPAHHPISRLPETLRPLLMRNIGTLSVVGVLLVWFIWMVFK